MYLCYHPFFREHNSDHSGFPTAPQNQESSEMNDIPRPFLLDYSWMLSSENSLEPHTYIQNFQGPIFWFVSLMRTGDISTRTKGVEENSLQSCVWGIDIKAFECEHSQKIRCYEVKLLLGNFILLCTRFERVKVRCDCHRTLWWGVISDRHHINKGKGCYRKRFLSLVLAGGCPAPMWYLRGCFSGPVITGLVKGWDRVGLR